ncbi:MAG: hypothetical protein IPP83_00485 [Flavobacteriales bacterium]|nr:hypothetical protein [Flavobacteriales bacterium]
MHPSPAHDALPFPFLFFVLATHLPAQEFTGAIPMSMRYGLDPHAVPTLEASPFDATAAAMDDAVRDAANKLPLYARFVVAPADLDHSGVWTELPGGDRIWRLRVVSPGAHAMELFFSDVYLPPGSQVHVYDDAREQVIGGSTAAHVQADGSFTTDMVYGDACTVEYHEPAAVRGEGSLHLEKVAHAYRMVAQVKSGTCEVDELQRRSELGERTQCGRADPRGHSKWCGVLHRHRW